MIVKSETPSNNTRAIFVLNEHPVYKTYNHIFINHNEKPSIKQSQEMNSEMLRQLIQGQIKTLLNIYIKHTIIYKP